MKKYYKFAFSSDKCLVGNRIYDYDEGENNYYDLDIQDPSANIINIDGIEYSFQNIENKGGNSIILFLYETQLLDDPVEYGKPDLVLKILKYPVNYKLENIHKRFKNEIFCLNQCESLGLQGVISIYHSGECFIRDFHKRREFRYFFYTMEFAEYDLKSFVEEKHKELELEDKISICLMLARGILDLEKAEIYHRDLKPDNIFFTQGEWKLGDLGLAKRRNTAEELDKVGEPIGPRGWMSPESMNKFLTEGRGFNFTYDCVIDGKSDIFQLGKIFWYVFQHNAPIGNLRSEDFKLGEQTLFLIILGMLSYDKVLRTDGIGSVIEQLVQVDYSSPT
jgi:serine/threonine protein kinase